MGGPVIPWPTPVVGAELISSEIPLRLPIDVLQNDPNNKDVFNLYIIALNLWQTSGNETIDPDNVNGTGYLQICGNIVRSPKCRLDFEQEQVSMACPL